MAAIITGLVVALFGAALIASGISLAVVGGSIFYIIMGLGVLVSGALLVFRRQTALWVYAATLIATFVWTIWEVGFDKWQWIPRGALITFLGLWIALPFITNALRRADQARGTPKSASPLGLRLTVAALALLGLGAWFYDPIVVEGELPVANGAAPAPAEGSPGIPADDWAAWGGTNMGQRYSSLSDINPDTVKNLKVAWEHRTGDLKGANDASEYTFEATPLKVNDLLYLCTPHNIVEALVPETGEVKWRFDPQLTPNTFYQHQTCRGVSYHDASLSPEAATEPAAPVTPAPANPDAATTPAPQPGQPALAPTAPEQTLTCERRIITTTVDARLFALNADTGELCTEFGENGFVNLLDKMPALQEASYMQTSAPLVTQGLIVLGGSISDNYYEDNTSGVIRAYDVTTGELVWKFDAQKPTEQAPLAEGETYEANSPVAWTTLSADEARGLVYIPFGNKSPDQFGMNRTTEDADYVDALVALDIATGQERWKFQTSYHDLWDRDIPSQPTLIDLPIDGQTVPAMVIPTKVGNLWILNRETGEPVFPTKEIAVSAETDVPEETPSAFQPMSPVSFTPPPLREADMWGITPFDQIACRVMLRNNRYDGNPFTPPTRQGSVIFPGNIGVFNWGSIAVDPINHWLIGTPMYVGNVYNVLPRPAGNTDERLVTQEGTRPINENMGGKFAINIAAFRSKLNLPCNTPPWGTMVGVDLKTGETAWKRRNGTVQDQMFLGMRFPIPLPMGILAHGGTLMTAGGVSFTAATADNYLRAYDMRTGEKLWQARLPAGGQATPMTYRGSDGKQYVVLAAGGHGSVGTVLGDHVIAYTLD